MSGRLYLSMAAIFWLGTAAHAQQVLDTFEVLRFRGIVGDMVWVTDTTGSETRGRVFAISDNELALGLEQTHLVFQVSDVRQITRSRRDSVRNGILLGAGTGAFLGFALGRGLDASSCAGSSLECGQGAMIGTIGGAFWGGVAGWIADSLVRKREVVYLARGVR